jgi:hypothetical protein
MSDELMQSVDTEDMSEDAMELSVEDMEEMDEQSVLEDIEVPIASELADDCARLGTAAAASAPATRSAPISESSFFIIASV